MLRLASGPPIAALLYLSISPACAWAQRVAGVVTGTATRHPQVGALIVLADVAEASSDTALTDERGRFVMEARSAGPHTITVRRVGQPDAEFGPVVLAAGWTKSVSLMVPEQPTVLTGVEVAAPASCRPHPNQGPLAAALWGEVQKAAVAVVLTREQRRAPLKVALFRRELDPRSLAVVREQRSLAVVAAVAPFNSAPADSLAAGGYVRHTGDSVVFFAPDASVLVSDSFVATHCLRLEPGDDTLVGLAFEPGIGRTTPDIAGVLWVDRRNAELRYLEFRYTSAPFPVAATHAGGRVDFARLPNGDWVVQRWVLTTPEFAARHRWSSVGEGISNRTSVSRKTTYTVKRYQQVGGELAAGAPVSVRRR